MLERIGRVNRELGTTVVLVTHDPDVAAVLPRTITIRDGRIGGEGRSGEEYAVVTADGFLPLPLHVARGPAARHAGAVPLRATAPTRCSPRGAAAAGGGDQEAM